MLNEARFSDHEHFMRRCFDLARRGLGYTRSNPVVGSVLVHDDRIIGEGWHRAWGGPHAEVECLEKVSPENKHLVPESTLYVSLEPCAHWGKQPPCAERIVGEGVRRVVVSVDDPNPQVGGRGYGILEAAGVEVVRGVLRTEGRWLARRFLSLHEQQRPYIILKWAQSADGFIAPAGGTRTQLSSTTSQRLVHKWRTEEGAILVGYRTAQVDNPRLTARFWEGPQPLRIVLDRRGSLPSSHHVFEAEAATWVLSEVEGGNMPSHANARRIQCDFDDTLFPTLLRELVGVQVSSIIIEGGAATLAALIRQGLWDECRIIQTPVVLGDGLPAPVLRNALPAFRSRLDSTDELTVFTREGSPWLYPSGAVL